ncbi:MAG: riboflavin biosynthesis protein RibF [Dehalococcoidia bacterium]
MPSKLAREELRRASLGRPTAVTVGKFDGLHRGHQALIQELKLRARERDLATGVVTFHPNPITVIRPGSPNSYLTSLDERIELLYGQGVDTVAPVTFTSELAQASAEEFARALKEDFSMALLVGGPDLALGRGREGTPERMRALGSQLGFDVQIIEFLTSEAGKIGSRAVREALQAGRVGEVARLLGRPFSLAGPVIRGAMRGRELGYPTANIAIGADRELPAFGIYATRAYLGEQAFASVTYVGPRPTFDAGAPSVEPYILDFDADIYGRRLRIDFIERLRGDQRFTDLDSLKEQMARDVVSARKALA